jgi:hypothetical protein
MEGPSLFANILSLIWPFLVLAVIWILLRFVFRMAMRVMAAGCAVLLVIAVGLIIFRLFLH